MTVSRARQFTVTTIEGKTVQVHRSPGHLYLDGLPTACITPDIEGVVCIFTGRPHERISQLRPYVFRGSTFWDILYDVPPTKELAGQLQALLMQFQQLTLQFVNQLPNA